MAFYFAGIAAASLPKAMKLFNRLIGEENGSNFARIATSGMHTKDH